MSKTPAWFPFYHSDYLSSTYRLTTLEHGAYMLLLIAQFQRGELPDDDAALAEIAGMRIDHWRRIASRLRVHFEPGENPGTIRQPRMHEERLKAMGLVAKRTGAANERWRNKRANVGGTVTQSDSVNALNNQETADAHGYAPEAVCMRQPEPHTQEDTSLRSVSLNAREDEPAKARKPEPVAHRLPAAWTPSQDDRAYAEARGLDADEVAEDFRGYWLAKGGKEARKTDWSLTWQGWCRREAKHSAHRPASRHPSLLDRAPVAEEAPVPEEVNGWIIAGVVEECNRIMHADGDGLWGEDRSKFSRVIADALAHDADPDRHLYPVMRNAARWGIRRIESVGYFRAGIAGLMGRREVA